MLTVALVIGLSNTTSGAASIEGLPLTKAAPVHSAPRGAATATGSLPVGRVGADSCASARKALRYYRARYVYWLDKMGEKANPSKGAAQVPGSPASRAGCPRYLGHLWQRKARAARVAYLVWFRRTYEKYRCLHEHEGSWTSETGNGYHGGLQFDDGFQRTYGPEFMRRWGNASAWPVYAQLIAAERAFYGFAGYGGRGYAPWGTRGACGL